jgi:hypothetical protein
MANLKDIPALLVLSAVILTILFLSYSKYFIKTELEVRILDQASSCYADQPSATGGAWHNGNIVMTSAFETPDPCHWVSSIEAYQQGDRLEIKIKISHQGFCIQCFGFREVDYEIVSPEPEKTMDIYIEVEGITKQKALLSLPV